jgi:hypothetical protein
MTTPKTAEVRLTRDQDHGEWLQVTPGERFNIRVPSAQTNGAYSVIEIVADPRNGVPLHIHNKEEEHFIVLADRRPISPRDLAFTARPARLLVLQRLPRARHLSPTNQLSDGAEGNRAAAHYSDALS